MKISKSMPYSKSAVLWTKLYDLLNQTLYRNHTQSPSHTQSHKYLLNVFVIINIRYITIKRNMPSLVVNLVMFGNKQQLNASQQKLNKKIIHLDEKKCRLLNGDQLLSLNRSSLC